MVIFLCCMVLACLYWLCCLVLFGLFFGILNFTGLVYLDSFSHSFPIIDILCFVFVLVVLVLCLLCQMLQFSLDFPFLIAPSVFSGFSILDCPFGFLGFLIYRCILHVWSVTWVQFMFIWLVNQYNIVNTRHLYLFINVMSLLTCAPNPL